MKKRILYIVILLLFAVPFAAEAAEFGEGPPEWLPNYDYRVWINGEYISLKVPPLEENDGTVLIPLRAVLEVDGSIVTFDNAARNAIITTPDDDTILFNIDTGIVQGYGGYRYIVKEGKTLIEPRFFDLVGGLSLAQDDYTRTIVVTTDRVGYDQVIPYDLGMGAVNDWGNRDIPYAIQGAMIVPDKENSPVIIITHGCHSIKKAAETRYDIGFGYLMKALAKQGYAVFSLNMNMQFSFENGEPNESARSKQIMADHVSRMIRANDGEDSGFPVSLGGRLDMQNVTLIGHSRNGRGIFWLAPVVEELGGKINSLFAYAPAIVAVVEDAYPDVPTAIFVPSQDGDVRTMDGYKVYDVIHDMTREADTHLAYLFGGNHASFNEALLPQDNRLRNIDPEKTVPIIDPERQRSIHTAYILDFLEAVRGGGDLGGLPHGIDGSFYSEKALLSFIGGNREVLPVEFSASNGAVVEDVVGSYMFSQNTAGYMNFPGNPQSLPLYQISWENEGAKIELPIGVADASGWRALVIDLAQDSTSPLNKQQDQSMTVILTDKTGKTAKVDLPQSTAALSWQKGEIVNHNNFQGEYWYSTYTEYTPLSSVVLPLSDFTGVNLHDLQSVTLALGGSSGRIVVRSVSLAL